jgi:uncharacterized membrane protein
MFKRQSLTFIVAISLFIFATFSGYLVNKASTFVTPNNHFSFLAYSFIHKDLFLSPINLPTSDFADYRARQYLFYGPLPSVALIPFVLFFGKNFPETFLSFVSLVFIFVAVYFISKKFVRSKQDAFMLSNFFVFGTVLYFFV